METVSSQLTGTEDSNLGNDNTQEAQVTIDVLLMKMKAFQDESGAQTGSLSASSSTEVYDFPSEDFKPLEGTNCHSISPPIPYPIYDKVELLDILLKRSEHPLKNRQKRMNRKRRSWSSPQLSLPTSEDPAESSAALPTIKNLGLAKDLPATPNDSPSTPCNDSVELLEPDKREATTSRCSTETDGIHESRRNIYLVDAESSSGQSFSLLAVGTDEITRSEEPSQATEMEKIRLPFARHESKRNRARDSIEMGGPGHDLDSTGSRHDEDEFNQNVEVRFQKEEIVQPTGLTYLEWRRRDTVRQQIPFEEPSSDESPPCIDTTSCYQKCYDPLLKKYTSFCNCDDTYWCNHEPLTLKGVFENCFEGCCTAPADESRGQRMYSPGPRATLAARVRTHMQPLCFCILLFVIIFVGMTIYW